MLFTEYLWNRICALDMKSDQVCLNQALLDMTVVWKQTTKDSKICTINNGWESEDAPIRVFVFSQKQFCRSCCNRKMSRHKKLYLVHPLTNDKTYMNQKEHYLKNMQAWFLD